MKQAQFTGAKCDSGIYQAVYNGWSIAAVHHCHSSLTGIEGTKVCDGAVIYPV